MPQMNAIDRGVTPAAAERIDVDCVRSAGEFRALRSAWTALYAAVPGTTPFQSWEWLFSWWQAYGGDRPLRVVVCRAGDAALGIAPFYLARETIAPGVAARVLRLVGDGSFDSDYLGALAAPGARASVDSALADWLARNREWDALAVRDARDGSQLPALLEREARAANWHWRSELGRCGIVDLPPTFDEFLRARPPRFRTRIRALLRRVDGGDAVFEPDCAARELRSRLRSLFALHQARWTASGGAGVFGASPRRRFYAHFAPRFARNGWLRLYSLRAGGRYVAHQLCFGDADTTYLLQEGFDVSDPTSSYGQMLRAAVLRMLIERGARSYDFLGGYSRHKEDWGARELPTTHAIVARRSLLGTMYFKRPLWRERLAGNARRLLPEPVVRWVRGARGARQTP
jgi:CelD/BcsL family acetyltransferase involved in cellulose biosynthesis